MGKKIKEIEIEAFRAYKEKQTFPFINEISGDIANLVVIYAPNGYGKTSFFDAIEWLITSEIGRLNAPGAMKEEVSQEEGYILKNRESTKDHGTVKIVTEDDATLIRETKKGRYKNDYNKQSVTREMNPILSGLEQEKQNFCTTNLLAHDKCKQYNKVYRIPTDKVYRNSPQSVQVSASKCTEAFKSDIIKKISEKAGCTENERNQNVRKNTTNEKSRVQPNTNSKRIMYTPKNSKTVLEYDGSRI